MAKSTLYPQLYKCDSCEKEQKHYVWSNEVEMAQFQCKTEGCRSVVGIEQVVDESTPTSTHIVTDTSKQYLQKDRKQRNTKDFIKNTYPTFKKGSLERKHFSNKYSLKK